MICVNCGKEPGEHTSENRCTTWSERLMRYRPLDTFYATVSPAPDARPARPRPFYKAVGLRVMLADRAICTAVSNTLAKRIAAALNHHTPDRRGI